MAPDGSAPGLAGGGTCCEVVDLASRCVTSDARGVRIVVFPGQGSEAVGMGLELTGQVEARRVFDAASSVIGLDALRVIERGGSAFERGEVIQPLLVAVGLAFASMRPLPDVVCGHSLGELTACAVGFGLDVEAVLRWAKARGRAMGEAAARGGLVAFRTVPPELLAELESRGLVMALENAPDEVVLAGDFDGLRWAEARGGRRLRVRGPLHHPSLMASARGVFAESLPAVLDARPRCRVRSLITQSDVEGGSLRELILDALVRPVRLRSGVRGLRDEHPGAVFEFAPPSRVVRSLVRRCVDGDSPGRG